MKRARCSETARAACRGPTRGSPVRPESGSAPAPAPGTRPSWLPRPHAMCPANRMRQRQCRPENAADVLHEPGSCHPRWVAGRKNPRPACPQRKPSRSQPVRGGRSARRTSIRAIHAAGAKAARTRPLDSAFGSHRGRTSILWLTVNLAAWFGFPIRSSTCFLFPVDKSATAAILYVNDIASIVFFRGELRLSAFYPARLTVSSSIIS